MKLFAQTVQVSANVTRILQSTPNKPSLNNSSVESYSSFFWIHVEVPVNATVLSVSLLKPLIALGEVMALELEAVSGLLQTYAPWCTYKAPRRTQRARMHALQHKMLIHRDALHPVLRRRPPSQEHYTIRPDLRHGVDNLLRQQLPALAGVRVCLVLADSKARVQQQDTAVRPGREETTLVRRRLVVGVVDLEGLVDVLEGGWRRCGRTDGEAEAVGLVGVMVRVLACDDYFDGVEWCVSRPVANVSYCQVPSVYW